MNFQQVKKYDRPTNNPNYKAFNQKQKANPTYKSLTQCTYYMSRKKRNCSHRISSQGSKFCSIHDPVNLHRLQQESVAGHQLKEEESLAKQNGPSEPTEPTSQPHSEPEHEQQVGKKRRRPRTSAPKRMVNPFSNFYSQTLNLPTTWNQVFENPELPLTIDVGCARGTMLDLLADKHPDRNFLGIEIRPKLVEEAIERNQTRNNVHFLAGNFSSIEATRLIRSFKNRKTIELICFQFPDPWRSNRKQKRRRILQTELIEAIATDCVAGTNIYVSTDVKDLALQMKELLDGCSKLELELNRKVIDSNVATKSTTESTSTKSSKESPTESSTESSTESFEGWMAQSILSIPSERELVCEQDWRPVYRTSYRVIEIQQRETER